MPKSLIVSLSDDLDDRFRTAIFTAKGFRKGAITEATVEAIESWIKTNGKK